jgi:hypothetical protein
LPGAIGDPTSPVVGKLDATHGRRIPEETVASARDHERYRDLCVALHQVHYQALLVETPVQVLAEAKEPFSFVCLEALLQAVIPIAVGHEMPRPRPPKVGLLLRKQLASVLGAREAQKSVGGDLSAQPPVDQRGPVAACAGRENRARCDERARELLCYLSLARPHPDGVVAPSFQAQALVARGVLERHAAIVGHYGTFLEVVV